MRSGESDVTQHSCLVISLVIVVESWIASLEMAGFGFCDKASASQLSLFRCLILDYTVAVAHDLSVTLSSSKSNISRAQAKSAFSNIVGSNTNSALEATAQ